MTRYTRYQRKTYVEATPWASKPIIVPSSTTKNAANIQSRRVSNSKNDIVSTKSRSSRRKQQCFNCRRKGHSLRECPNAQESVSSSSKNNDIHNIKGSPFGICFHCGKSDHLIYDCAIGRQVQSGQLPKDKLFAFASCFVCKKRGHLSGQCPENSKGCFPNGGSCHHCGSVNHFARDCDQKPQQLSTRFSENDRNIVSRSADDDDTHLELSRAESEKLLKPTNESSTTQLKKPKTVVFRNH